MPKLRAAFTGDYLDEHHRPAYGDYGFAELGRAERIEFDFIRAQAPRPGDAGYWQRLYSMEVTPDQVQGLDALVVLRPAVNRPAIAAAAGRLVVIGRSGAGYEKIDVAACTEHDIALFNAPLGLDHATASTALMFMLVLAKRLAEQQAITRQAQWHRQADVTGSEIQGKTLGIIGLGHSGRELVRLAAPFGMRVLAFSPHADPAVAASLRVELTGLDALLSQSDFVSLHARMSDSVRGLIGAPQLARMKPSAFLVNIARGAMIDQAALVTALRERRIAGAALDVFQVEPLPPDDPLIGLDNVVITPHWSASTREVWAVTGKAMADGLLRVSRGEVPDHVVNAQVLSRRGFKDKLARFAAQETVE